MDSHRPAASNCSPDGMPAVCIVLQGVYDIDARVRRKAAALVADGYSVDVIALRPDGGSPRYCVDGVGIRTINLGKKRGSLIRYAFEYVTFFLWALARVSWQMVQRRYIAVDVNTLPDFLVFAAAPAKWMGATVILDMHEITPEFYMSKYRAAERGPVIRFLKYVERRSFAFADRVLTINEPVQDLLIGRGLAPDKSTVVMNAVDESRFAAGQRPEPAPAPPADRFVMMYHGTLTRIYGLDVAIEAFAMAHGQMPGCELRILGSGPEREPLRRLAARLGVESRVTLIGQVPPADIPRWLSQCDAGILPIRRDVFLDFAFPNKLPEFIVNGKPVIVSRLKTIRHYFSESALIYFEPNNPADLAAQMIRVYRDPALRGQKAAVAAREYAPIAWGVMRDRYLTVVKASVDQREPIPVGF
jgi:glycosyltransferase involved in cell wall biosynthesis